MRELYRYIVSGLRRVGRNRSYLHRLQKALALRLEMTRAGAAIAAVPARPLSE